MKRLVAILLVTTMTTAMILSGCGSANTAATADAAVNNEKSEDEIGDDKESEPQEAVEDNSDDEVEMPSDYAISKVLDKTLDWFGLQYMYDPTTDYETLTNDAAVEMAAFACACVSEFGDYEYCEDGLIIPKYVLDEQMQNLFGKTYNEDKYEAKHRGYVKTGPGKVYVTIGDWGLVCPRYSIVDKTKCEDNTFDINIRYYAQDLELNTEYGNYRYDVKINIRPDESSENEFVINNLAAKRTGLDPEKFNPAEIEGVYKAEIPETKDEETVYRTAWIVIDKDGKGYMYDREMTQISVGRYDITPDDQQPIPYYIYEDTLSVFYPGNEFDVKYIKTDEEPEL